MGSVLDFAVGVLNGAVGDYLVREGNGLATPMTLAFGGAPLDPAALVRVYPTPTPRAVLLVHGLMCTESVWAHGDGRSDYGTMLARDLGLTPLYVRYNSGRAIADNGKALAELVAQVDRAYPVPLEELVLVGHSMGGLVARSAVHVASRDGMPWVSRVKRAIYLGTPHLGVPLERAGRVVASILRAIEDPYTRLVGRIADLRSDGIKDLGDANLRHEDRAPDGAREHGPVPLAPSIAHHFVAGSLGHEPWLAELVGDALVPVSSAHAGGGSDAKSSARVKLLPGLGHMDLANHPQVYAHIRAWCEAT